MAVEPLRRRAMIEIKDRERREQEKERKTTPEGEAGLIR